eukprot:RCo040723
MADGQRGDPAEVPAHPFHALSLVRVIDDVQQAPRLRTKGTDLPITPPADNTLAILRELHAVALQVLDLDPQQLLPGLGIPDPNVMVGAGGEDLTVPMGKADVVDALEVAGLPELLLKRLGVQVVDIGLAGAHEVVVAVRRHRRDHPLQRDRFDFLKVRLGEESDFSRTAAHQHITVVCDAGAEDALGKRLGGPGELQDLRTLQLDAQYVSRSGAHEGVVIRWLDNDCSAHALQVAHVDICGVDLAVHKVDVPHPKHAVTPGDGLLAVAVKEGDAHREVRRGRSSAKRTPGGQVPHHKGVVVLPAQAG